jgi:arylsulfatase
LGCACADYEDKGVFPFTGEIESVTFMFAPTRKPTGMERLKLATRMD